MNLNEPKIRTIRDKIRDAINAFKGKKIGSLHFGIDVKRCDECEYRKAADSKVLYLCDQQFACKDSAICGTECKHTLNILYAKNFECIDEYYWENEEKDDSKCE